METGPPPNIVPVDSPPRQHPNSTVHQLRGYIIHLKEENIHLHNLLDQAELDHGVTVRELEAKIRALSDTLKEERASKKKVMIQRGYFMELCDSWGEYAEIFRHTLMGLAGESLREDNPRFVGCSHGWVKQALFAANLFLKVLEDWVKQEQWDKLRRVNWHRHFYGYQPNDINTRFTNIIPLHQTTPIFPPGFCDGGPVYNMNSPGTDRDPPSLPQPTTSWYRRLPHQDHMSRNYAVVDLKGDGELQSEFPFWDVDLQENEFPIRDHILHIDD